MKKKQKKKKPNRSKIPPANTYKYKSLYIKALVNMFNMFIISLMVGHSDWIFPKYVSFSYCEELKHCVMFLLSMDKALFDMFNMLIS